MKFKLIQNKLSYIKTYARVIKFYLQFKTSDKLPDTKIVLIILAALFGISKRMYLKYEDQTYILFQNTLPGLSLVPNQIAWPTFDQFLSYKIQSECAKNLLRPQNNLSIKRLDFYNDCIIMQSNLDWHTKQKQIYLGNFYSIKINLGNSVNQNQNQFKINSNKQQIGKNWHTISSQPKKKKASKKFALINKTTYLPFDELPRKIACINTHTPNIFESNFNFPYLNAPFSLKSFIKKTISLKSKNNIFLINQFENTKLKKFNAPHGEKLVNKKKRPFFYQLHDSTTKNFPISTNKQITFNSTNLNNQQKIPQPNIKFVNKSLSFFFFKNFNLASAYSTGGSNEQNLNLLLNKKLIFVTPKYENQIFQKKKIFKEIEFLNKQKNKNFFLEKKLKENYYYKNYFPFSNFNELNFPNFVKEKISKDNNKFFQNINIAAELNYTPGNTIDELSIKKKTNKFDENTAKENIEPRKLIELIRSIAAELPFNKNYIITPRAMSGYILPDTSYDFTKSMIAQNFYVKTNKLLHTIFTNWFKSSCSTERGISLNAWNPIFQVNLPKNSYFFYSSFFSFNNLKSQLACYDIKNSTRFNRINFTYTKTKKELDWENLPLDLIIKVRKQYKGLTFVYKCNKVTDDVDLVNEIKAQNSLKRILGSGNILTDRRNIFFGKNVYADFENFTHFSVNSNFQKQLIQQNLDTSFLNINNDNFSPVQLQKKKLNKTKRSFFGTHSFRNRRKKFRFEVKFKQIRIPSIYVKHNLKKNKQPNEIYDSGYIIRYKKISDLVYSSFFEKAKLTSLVRYPTKKPYEPCVFWPINQLPVLNNFDMINEFNSKIHFKSVKKINLKKNFESESEFNLKNIRLVNHSFPYSENLSKEIVAKTRYKIQKKPSSYKNINFKNQEIKKKSKKEYELYEPISVDSWLFFTKFPFNFYLLVLVKILVISMRNTIKEIFTISIDEDSVDSSNDNAGQGLNQTPSLNNSEKTNKNFNSPSLSTSVSPFNKSFKNIIKKNILNRTKKHQFRLKKNVKKNFSNIAGIQNIFTDISELVWFLKKASKTSIQENNLSKRILLTGPPGTGKTLLVQAIAGEAEVPVLIESGSALSKMKMNNVKRLANLFTQARKIAPCIIFIDEIDSFGKKRNDIINSRNLNLVANHVYPEINSNYFFQKKIKKEDLNFSPFKNIVSKHDIKKDIELMDFYAKYGISRNFEKYRTKKKNKHLRLLIELLIQLDGIKSNNHIVVFAATNRPEILDEALTRPGRFNKRLELSLPSKEKRIEILKLYSKNIGYDSSISWNYLADRTFGLSAAELASIMNHSSLKAIQNETFHTLQTIEIGIDYISGYTLQKSQFQSFSQKQRLPINSNRTNEINAPQNNLSSKNTMHAENLIQNKSTIHLNTQFSQKNELKPIISSANSFKLLYLNRLAYYQAGKALIQIILPYHPPLALIQLWPQLKNLRSHSVYQVFEKEFSRVKTRIELESRIIGFYGGKAGELIALFHGFENVQLSLQKKTQKQVILKSETQIKNDITIQDISKKHKSLYLWQSDLGNQDLNLAGWVAQLMITKWSLYSIQSFTKEFQNLPINENETYITDSGKLNFLKLLIQEFESEQTQKNQKNQITRKNFIQKKESNLNANKESQDWKKKIWLQKRIFQKFEVFNNKWKTWNELYLTNMNDTNDVRYVFPDIYYHSNNRLKNLLNTVEPPRKENFSKKSNIVKAKIYLHTVNLPFKENYSNPACKTDSCFAPNLASADSTGGSNGKKNKTQILFKPTMESNLNWNDKFNFYRGFIYHSLLLSCFNKSISILDNKRELLDLFASYLLQKEIIREHEILHILNNFSVVK